MPAGGRRGGEGHDTKGLSKVESDVPKERQERVVHERLSLPTTSRGQL